MPLALILSSHVAGSRVGGFPQALVLARFGIDPVLLPTVLFGRRPGLETPPGGGPVGHEQFAGMLEGAAAHGLFGLADAVVTGYFASAAQVEAAADAIDRVRAAPREGAFNPRPLIVVDPILGDEPDGLYVRPEVAEALEALLLPRADVLTPNLWELRRLAGGDGRAASLAEIAAMARELGRPALVTSIPAEPGRTGALFLDVAEVVVFSHALRADTPHGTGDLVAAVLTARLILGASPAEAAEAAIRAVADAADAAAAWRAPELPLVALGERLLRPAAEVLIRRLDASAPGGA